ncbi:MAG: tRNA (adenosine(37)-N6)-threonylcarbamoyltransferase complex ATPase subunit type 1 TsaE [Chitinophagaceae bacterium]
MEIAYQLPEIHQAAEKFWRESQGAKIFAFHGPMGAGKTTLIKALCQVKGIQETVSSPTFSIINEYKGWEQEGCPITIFHLDLYRLSDSLEARQAGVEECFYQDSICLVEWPQRAPSLFPKGTVGVFLRFGPDPLSRILEIRLPS